MHPFKGKQIEELQVVTTLQSPHLDRTWLIINFYLARARNHAETRTEIMNYEPCFVKISFSKSVRERFYSVRRLTMHTVEQVEEKKKHASR